MESLRPHCTAEYCFRERVLACKFADNKMAVRVGFEPTEPVKVQRFSRPPDSTTLAPHRRFEFYFTKLALQSWESSHALSHSSQAPSARLPVHAPAGAGESSGAIPIHTAALRLSRRGCPAPDQFHARQFSTLD